MTQFFRGLGQFSVPYRFAIVAFWIALVVVLIYVLSTLASVLFCLAGGIGGRFKYQESPRKFQMHNRVL